MTSMTNSKSKSSNLFLILIVTILLATGHLFSQNKTIDSLKLALKNAKHDTTRLRLRNAIGEDASIYRIGYWDSLCFDAKRLNMKKILLKQLRKKMYDR